MNSAEKKSQISIIGCGWLGLPLAKLLIKNGYKIKGSTTSESKLSELKLKGIIPFLVELNEKSISDSATKFLAESETLVINIPPGLIKNPDKNHVSENKKLVEAVEKSNIKRVIYVSSTSVFKDAYPFPTITDLDAPNATSNSGKQLIKIENLLKANPNFETTILRFSGLIGNERHPGKILSGRKDVSNADAPVNLIHINDCISVIFSLIKNEIINETFNASFPFHPSKKSYYTDYCKMYGLEIPYFSNSPSKGKIIDGSRLAQLLKYEYKTGV